MYVCTHMRCKWLAFFTLVRPVFSDSLMFSPALYCIFFPFISFISSCILQFTQSFWSDLRRRLGHQLALPIAVAIFSSLYTQQSLLSSCFCTLVCFGWSWSVCFAKQHSVQSRLHPGRIYILIHIYVYVWYIVYYIFLCVVCWV